jgi:hypothetical protein
LDQQSIRVLASGAGLSVASPYFEELSSAFAHLQAMIARTCSLPQELQVPCNNIDPTFSVYLDRDDRLGPQLSYDR